MSLATMRVGVFLLLVAALGLTVARRPDCGLGLLLIAMGTWTLTMSEDHL